MTLLFPVLAFLLITVSSLCLFTAMENDRRLKEWTGKANE